jgi:uncharacterized protein
MSKDALRYDKMVEAALRGVVREALGRAARSGLPGAHHFYITFRTGMPGVAIPDYLREKYPEEMTIVLEHQFWDLAIENDGFGVTLSFQNRPERLTIPFAAITAFADPSVKFGLQFQPVEDAEAATSASPPPAVPRPAEAKPVLSASSEAASSEAGKAKPEKTGEVVALDAFRKK